MTSTMTKVNYNERAWAIDVISDINVHLETKSWHFKKAGGENTIKNGKTSLFPDVLVFEDKLKSTILQGWELKMPDTPINDAELISNAIKKANIVGTNSFVLWNVKSAVLYVRNDQGFTILKSWDDININKRTDVEANVGLWQTLLYEILEDLNDFFANGTISVSSSKHILSIDQIIDVVLENTASTSENIRKHSLKDGTLDANINTWWRSSSTEYGYNFSIAGKDDKRSTLSMIILTDWVFKIVFTHIIKRHFNEAKDIEDIDSNTSIVDAIAIIESISDRCNFWNILSPNLAQECVSLTAWSQITQLNQFLSSININNIDADVLHQLLQNAVVAAKRKVAGQYSTPKELADLLTRLTISDKNGIVIDPCCGTGTIINQAWQLKEEYELSQNEILDSIWASDKHSFPIQLSTLTMAKPSNIGKIVNIFTSDVTDLATGNKINFKDPNNGKTIPKAFPKIDYIVSNLPFIKNKEMKVLNPNITSINKWIKKQTGTNKQLGGKSDIYIYMPFYFHQLLSDDGKIGLILSNAWLGTDYGKVFLDIFKNFFTVESVIISGKGRWFSNAKVVTTMLLATKKDPKAPISSDISFCTILEKLENIDDLQSLSDNITVSNSADNLIINRYSQTEIKALEKFGIPWSGYFTNLSWLPQITSKLINVNSKFDITRGERRGWDKMFYPAKGHNIESEYIKSVIKNLKTTKRLLVTDSRDAFCCSLSINDLKSAKHTGALNWINTFINGNNNSGEPLTTSLKSANLEWYEMKTDNMADFALNVNSADTLFVARLKPRAFINQRMIGLKFKNEGEDALLYWALLNCNLNMFLIESFGFGRGDSVLDLNSKKFKENFKILDPDRLTADEKTKIVASFMPLTQRDKLPLEKELKSPDRIKFESTLMKIYGISDSVHEQIQKSLLHLFKIRFAVKQ